VVSATKTILFRTALAYLVVTVLNITVFVVMVFENQIDLISENAVLRSQNVGTSLKSYLDETVSGKESLGEDLVAGFFRRASGFGALRLVVFSEAGDVLFAAGERTPRAAASANAEQFSAINTAIMKRDFEDKLFFHRIDRAARTVELFIPFVHSGDRLAVATVTLAMRDLDRQMTLLYRQCALMALFIVLVHSLFVVLVLRILILPLRTLLQGTARMAQGDLAVQVPVVRDDEIGRLARSFNEMSVALKRLNDEARDANPLTGLPGNLSIARCIGDRLKSGGNFAVLYCDLDNFKAYNDKYGFSRGDEAILFTRDSLLKAYASAGNGGTFIGHQGGDDFIVVASSDGWEPCTKRFVAMFDEGVRGLYAEVDAANGYIESVDRKGARQRFPLMTISVAVVLNQRRAYLRHEQMAESAAEVKKWVKGRPGTDRSGYAVDRRAGDDG